MSKLALKNFTRLSWLRYAGFVLVVLVIWWPELEHYHVRIPALDPAAVASMRTFPPDALLDEPPSSPHAAATRPSAMSNAMARAQVIRFFMRTPP